MAPEKTDERILEKVRKLLATAESYAVTGNEDAAATYREQAMAMLTRYQLDEAMLDHGRPAEQRLTVIVKMVECEGAHRRRWRRLLGIVAREMGVRSVHHQDHMDRTGTRKPSRWLDVDLIGFETDIAAVELLWTSLLMQAQSELRVIPQGSNRRVFQMNFIDGFTSVIATRMAVQHKAAAAAAEEAYHGSLLPVLRDRKVRIDEFIDSKYGRLTQTHLRGTSIAADGIQAGREAGRRATLDGKAITGSQGQIGGGS